MSSEADLNLFAPGPGLFDTHVTWEDVESDMRTSFGTAAQFGPNKTIKTIGDDKGFMSRICLVEPDWQGVADYEELPSKFVVKVCTLVAAMSVARRMMESRPELREALLIKIQNLESHLKHLHNVEVDVYHLMEKYNLTQKAKQAWIYLSTMFTEENPVKGNIIMEFVDEIEPIHISDNLRPQDLYQPLQALAALQATSLKFTEYEIAIFTQNPLQDILKTIFTEESVQRTFTMLKGLDNGSFTPLVEKLEANWAEILNPKKFDDIPKELGMTPVFCHGDLWSTNLLWGKSEDRLQLKAIVDYQVAHFGNPAGDLSRLFGATLSAVDRRDNWESLLDVFYGFLIEELEGVDAPYSLKQLKTAYRLYFPAGAWMLLPVIGPLYEVVSRNADPEEKEKVDKIVMEKAMGLLEDLLSYHEQYSNKE